MFLILYLVPIFVLAAAYYFGIYLPAVVLNRRELFIQRHLMVGERILTAGGIIGQVVQKNKDTVIISLFDGSLAEVILEKVVKKFE